MNRSARIACGVKTPAGGESVSSASISLTIFSDAHFFLNGVLPQQHEVAREHYCARRRNQLRSASATPRTSFRTSIEANRPLTKGHNERSHLRGQLHGHSADDFSFAATSTAFSIRNQISDRLGDGYSLGLLLRALDKLLDRLCESRSGRKHFKTFCRLHALGVRQVPRLNPDTFTLCVRYVTKDFRIIFGPVSLLITLPAAVGKSHLPFKLRSLGITVSGNLRLGHMFGMVRKIPASKRKTTPNLPHHQNKPHFIIKNTGSSPVFNTILPDPLTRWVFLLLKPDRFND